MKQILKRYIPRSILEPYQMKKYGRFLWMRMQTEGLLSPEHYEAIHKFFLGHAIGGNDIVEIGGASGSASIAIGWAIKERRSKAKLLVVEKFEGQREAAMVRYLERNWYKRAASLMKKKALDRKAKVETLQQYATSELPEVMRETMAKVSGLDRQHW